jgi:threonine/homoserine efflux transporter RhtA
MDINYYLNNDELNYNFIHNITLLTQNYCNHNNIHEIILSIFITLKYYFTILLNNILSISINTWIIITCILLGIIILLMTLICSLLMQISFKKNN